jgi:alpha-1,6-mannosyltransferase
VRRTLPGVRFGVVGGLTLLLYVGCALALPLVPRNVYVPLLDLGKMTQTVGAGWAIYPAVVGVLFALYGAGYGLVATDRGPSLRTIFVLGALFCAPLILTYPASAVDVFGYVAQGRLLAVHGANPFSDPPNRFATDPIIPYLAFPGEPSQYGPLWAALGGAIALLAQGDLLAEVLAYKGVAVAAHLAGAGLIYRLAGCMDADPARARASSYLFLWNPTLLWEMAANAHNDGVMMLGGIGAAHLLASGRGLWALPVLALGALVKLPVIAVTPMIGLALWRVSRTRAVRSGLLAAAMMVVAYAPFWQGPATLTALGRSDLFTVSAGELLRLLLLRVVDERMASQIAHAASIGAFLGAMLLASALVLLRPYARVAVRAGYAAMLAAALFGTTWFQAWYIVWPFGFAAGLGERRHHLEVALLSLGGLLQYWVFIFLWFRIFPPGDNALVQVAAYAVVIVPLLLAFALAERGPSPPSARRIQPSGAG